MKVVYCGVSSSFVYPESLRFISTDRVLYFTRMSTLFLYAAMKQKYCVPTYMANVLVRSTGSSSSVDVSYKYIYSDRGDLEYNLKYHKMKLINIFPKARLMAPITQNYFSYLRATCVNKPLLGPLYCHLIQHVLCQENLLIVSGYTTTD